MVGRESEVEYKKYCKNARLAILSEIITDRKLGDTMRYNHHADDLMGADAIHCYTEVVPHYLFLCEMKMHCFGLSGVWKKMFQTTENHILKIQDISDGRP